MIRITPLGRLAWTIPKPLYINDIHQRNLGASETKNSINPRDPGLLLRGRQPNQNTIGTNVGTDFFE